VLLDYQTNFQVFRLINSFPVGEHTPVSNAHHQFRANRPFYVDLITYQLLVGRHLAPEGDVADAQGAAAARRAGPAQPETDQLPHGVQAQAAGRHGVVREVAFEEPEIGIDIQFRNDLAALAGAAVHVDPDDAVEHQHGRGGQLRVPGPEQFAAA